MITSYKASQDIHVLTSSFPFPGMGVVPINAFVLHGPEPMLVDTGAVVESEEFMAALRSIVDPDELAWIWLTHTDGDHIGSLHRLLAENAHLRVITTFLGVGIMSLSDPLPLERVRLVNPGEAITVGRRRLVAIRPPTFDNPSTTGFYDESSRALFSADCFGALLQREVQNAADLTNAELREGLVCWATVDSPWLHTVDRDLFASELDHIRQMGPDLVLSSHLPAARGDMIEGLLESLAEASSTRLFVGPDQAGFELMLAQISRDG